MQAIKTVGPSGQIALGKQYAGREVAVDQVEPGVWVIKLGSFLPDNERWLHFPEVASSIDRALDWAAAHPPADTDLERLERRLKR